MRGELALPTTPRRSAARIQRGATGEDGPMLRPLLLVSALFLSPLVAQQRLLNPDDLPARKQAAAELQATIDTEADLATTVAFAAIAGIRLPAGSNARAALDLALRTANTGSDAVRAGKRLRSELGDLVTTLTFEPLREAELPAGFPTFTAVDELELRHYPACRMVRTEMKAGGPMGAFWPLFQHIKDNDIAMTAPVQVDWSEAGERQRPARMAFLYGDPSKQPAQVGKDVSVENLPPTTVLSLGAIGEERNDVVAAMRERLLGWLRDNPQWVAAGPLRTMGYNSPMVGRDRRYFEVQIPVHRTDDRAAVVR